MRAWEALLAVVASGWYIGRPSYHDERDEWLQYAFDPSECGRWPRPSLTLSARWRGRNHVGGGCRGDRSEKSREAVGFRVVRLSLPRSAPRTL